MTSTFRRATPLAALLLLLALAGCRPGVHWSPDGTRIAFLAHHALFVYDTRSKAVRRISPTTGEAFGQAWSRDGRRLSYFLTTKEGTALSGVALVGVDVAKWEQAVLIPEVEGAMAVAEGGPHAPSGGSIKLTRAPEELFAETTAASWSSDGVWLRYVVATGRRTTVSRVRAAGGEPETVAVYAGEHRGFSWSPEGDRCAFFSEPGELLLAGGPAAPRRLWTPPAGSIPSLMAQPSWSRDGKRLIVLVEPVSASSTGRGAGQPLSLPGLGRQCSAYSVPVDASPATLVGAIPGPALFASVTDDTRRAFFYPIPPEDRMVLTEISFPTGTRRTLLTLPAPNGGKGKGTGDVQGARGEDHYIGSARPGISPDGRTMALVAASPGGGQRLVLLPMAGGAPRSVPIPAPPKS